MRRISILLYLAITLAASPGRADTKLSSTLDLQSTYAYKRGQWQENSAEWHPKWVERFAGGAKLTALALLRFDNEDQFQPGSPPQPFRARWTQTAQLSDKSEVELREIYLDHYFGNTFLRVGKQQIVWGQADGLRVLDVINPLSYREFILPDIEDRRIPLWSVLAEVPAGNWTWQVVWVPDATVTEYPLPGAAFALVKDPFGGKGRIQVNRPDSFQYSDAGFRASTYFSGWDLTFNYLFHTIDEPVLTVYPASQRLTANYNRSHLIGATASKAFGNFTFRSEAGVETDKRYPGSELNDVTRSEEFSYVLGLDYSGLRNVFLSAQFFQTWSREVPNNRDRAKEQSTLLYRQDAFNESLSWEILGIYDYQNEDSLVQTEVSYKLTTRWTFKAGGDLFFGDSSGLFGQFHEQGRIWLQATASL